jgi:acetylornithine deacetylase/succinyl-diaminopimelate desuccinylase-like protein
MMKIHALLLTLVFCSCAHSLPELPAGPRLPAAAGGIDWVKAGDEAVEVLAGYLQVNTANPPGNESAGAAYLAQILEREGIPSKTYEFAPGRGSLVARLPRAADAPGDEGAICLLSHIDVAAADASKWPEGKGPWSGVVDDEGALWGRGALDMKGMGVLELMSMIWLKRQGVPLRRDVVLIAVADEEVHNQGMKHLVDQHWEEIRCSHLINEGGLGIRDALFEGQTAFAISVGEKGVLWLRMTVRGEGGHGSTPRPGLAPVRLLDKLQLIREREVEARMHPSLSETLARAGDHGGGLTGFVLKRPLLVDWMAEGKLMGRPGTRAALIDTVNITGLDTGDHEPNVVPTEASALLDCRLLPDTSAAAMVRRLQVITGDDPDVIFETLFGAPASVSPWDDPLYQALARHAVAGRDDAVAGPVLSVGFTDSLYARARGVRAYGLIPFEITEEEALTMHAPHERVSVANVRRGLEILFKVLVEVSAQ